MQGRTISPAPVADRVIKNMNLAIMERKQHGINFLLNIFNATDREAKTFMDGLHQYGVGIFKGKSYQLNDLKRA